MKDYYDTYEEAEAEYDRLTHEGVNALFYADEDGDFVVETTESSYAPTVPLTGREKRLFETQRIFDPTGGVYRVCHPTTP